MNCHTFQNKMIIFCILVQDFLSIISQSVIYLTCIYLIVVIFYHRSSELNILIFLKNIACWHLPFKSYKDLFRLVIAY